MAMRIIAAFCLLAPASTWALSSSDSPSSEPSATVPRELRDLVSYPLSSRACLYKDNSGLQVSYQIGSFVNSNQGRLQCRRWLLSLVTGTYAVGWSYETE